MGRPKKPINEKKTEIITIRLPKKQGDAVRLNAEAAGVDVGVYVRAILLNQLGWNRGAFM